MSNQNKQTFSLPGRNVPPPPIAAPPPPSVTVPLTELLPEAAALLEKFPTPWVVTFNDDNEWHIFVASDIEKVTDQTKMNRPGIYAGWIHTCDHPRHVVGLNVSKDMAELIVHAVNKLKGG